MVTLSPCLAYWGLIQGLKTFKNVHVQWCTVLILYVIMTQTWAVIDWFFLEKNTVHSLYIIFCCSLAERSQPCPWIPMAKLYLPSTVKFNRLTLKILLVSANTCHNVMYIVHVLCDTYSFSTMDHTSAEKKILAYMQGMTVFFQTFTLMSCIVEVVGHLPS